ncbi:MAG: ribosomal-processing cysteine protease Prp [Ruminococcaceae bacterium]|nr:ribosomal-processing cysteine protease Prp [Oscillospiraceae bacterium]
MTKALFFRNGSGELEGFCIEGHSGLSTEGSDILCAAISSMTQLVVNTVTEDLGVKMCVTADDESAAVKAMLSGKDDPSLTAARALISGFYRELSVLQKAYPKNLSLREKSI